MNQSELTYVSGQEPVVFKLRDDMNQINEQFRVLGLPNMDATDIDLGHLSNTRNVNQIPGKGSGGSVKSYLSTRNKYCYNNM